MTACLLMRLEAPLMSFGAVRVDSRGPTARFPSVSMLTGLLGNALGWRYPRDDEKLDRLQGRISFAARMDRESARGAFVEDFQTVAFPEARESWTTLGRPETRRTPATGSSGRYLRRREYLQDASIAIALSLDPESESPCIAELADALARPSRPLYIGRKSCPPQSPILAGITEASDALDALGEIVPPGGATEERPRHYALGEDIPADAESVCPLSITDMRNWRATGLHGGERIATEFRRTL